MTNETETPSAGAMRASAAVARHLAHGTELTPECLALIIDRETAAPELEAFIKDFSGAATASKGKISATAILCWADEARAVLRKAREK